MKVSEKKRSEGKRRVLRDTFIDVNGVRHFKKVELVNSIKCRWEDK